MDRRARWQRLRAKRYDGLYLLITGGVARAEPRWSVQKRHRKPANIRRSVPLDYESILSPDRDKYRPRFHRRRGDRCFVRIIRVLLRVAGAHPVNNGLPGPNSTIRERTVLAANNGDLDPRRFRFD